ncbi:hypothetical protein [Kutzneria sp. NPDC052558]|uniref:hypothetical protein n=1 Tax=Kutzneria sp. NPDC052558 TaxID=3364121 RepID=UPI0037C9C3A9
MSRGRRRTRQLHVGSVGVAREASNRLAGDPEGTAVRSRIGTVSSKVVPGEPVVFALREGTAVLPMTPKVPASGAVQWVPANGDVPVEPVAFLPRGGELVTPQTPSVPADE